MNGTEEAQEGFGHAGMRQPWTHSFKLHVERAVAAAILSASWVTSSCVEGEPRIQLELIADGHPPFRKR